MLRLVYARRTMLPLLWRGALALISAPRCPACGGAAAEPPRAVGPAPLCADCVTPLGLPTGGIQGDEPLISPALIDELAVTLRAEASIPMITAAVMIHDADQVTDANVVKVVTDVHGDALCFSRSTLPFVRTTDPRTLHKRHLGIYGFRRDFLYQFIAWPPSMLEMTESLEQLRALENGARIRVIMTSDLSPGVDTIEQARAVERLLAAKQPGA